MAIRTLRHRRRKIRLLKVVRSVCVSIGLMVALPAVAFAAMAVIDSTATSKLIQQINQLKKQFEVLEDTRDQMQQTANSIGKAGRIAVPFVNLSRLQSSLLSDAKCLLPDLSGLFPSIEFEKVGTSICDRRYHYQQALFPAPDIFKDLKTTAEAEYQINLLKERRIDALATATLDGLSQADRALETSQTTQEAINNLKSRASSAADQAHRLDAVVQAQIMMIQAQNQTNQLLAQSLKVQSATALALGVPLTEYMQGQPETETGGTEE